jgi:N-acyl homoserine lactone hydrolase
VRLHHVQTGEISIKRFHYRGVGFNRFSRLMMWTLVPGWVRLPVHAWVIEHPDGIIVVDTGEVHAASQPNFYANSDRRFFQLNFRFHIEPAQEIAPRLEDLGITPADVKTVILTHTHIDHSDGVNAFPNAEILVSSREWADVQRFGTFHGCVPANWSPDLNFKPIIHIPDAIGSFPYSYPVTSDGAVRIVPTPGHTMGHQSVLVQEGDIFIMFAGDTSFDLAGLYSNTISGVTHSAKAERETRQQIRDFAKDHPLVYLPSHDSDSARRFHTREVITTI